MRSVPGRLEHRVELPLHVFPDAVAPGPDHHATAHVRGLGQLRRADDLLIPFGKVFFAPRRDRGFCGGGIHCARRFTETPYNCRAAVSAANWDFMPLRLQMASRHLRGLEK